MASAGPRSGLIIEVPEAEPAVARHRERLDASARLGIPAHITVLFPFMPPQAIGPAALTGLEHLLAAFPRFRFQLDHTAWFGDEVLWLAPRDPSPFRALTRSVADAFPAFPPYEGQFGDSTPHLTIGHEHPRGRPARRRRARPRLPAHPRTSHRSHPDDPAIHRRAVDQSRHLHPGPTPITSSSRNAAGVLSRRRRRTFTDERLRSASREDMCRCWHRATLRRSSRPASR